MKYCALRSQCEMKFAHIRDSEYFTFAEQIFHSEDISLARRATDHRHQKTNDSFPCCSSRRIQFHNVGRGQCLRSKLDIERSEICLHPAAKQILAENLFSLPICVIIGIHRRAGACSRRNERLCFGNGGTKAPPYKGVWALPDVFVKQMRNWR